MLKGKTVVITRPIHQAKDLVELVKMRGGKTRVVPTVEIDLISDVKSVEAPINLIISGKVDIIIFMSQNGVSSFLRISQLLRKDNEILNALQKMQVFAIGVKTKKLLEEEGIRVDLTPTDHSSFGLANALGRLEISNKVIALPRTDKPTDYLNKKINEMSANIVQFTTYETRLPRDPTDVLKLIKDISNGQIDIITFTSSATANNLLKISRENGLEKELIHGLNKYVIVVTIGPVTRETLEKNGVAVKVTPTEYTIEKMIDTLDNFFDEQNNDFDELDHRLLAIIQDNVPLEAQPWSIIANQLGISSNEVINRLQHLSKKGVIRKIGPVIDARKVGLTASTLVGMKVPTEKLNEVVEIINDYSEVSHNYERPHEYNIWFTVTSYSQNEMERILREIGEKSGISDESILNLQTERLFKIKPSYGKRGS
jgi:uroporphyrinogen-III synthase/DNA-binding Lrp family transcriptional regulator